MGQCLVWWGACAFLEGGNGCNSKAAPSSGWSLVGSDVAFGEFGFSEFDRKVNDKHLVVGVEK